MTLVLFSCCSHPAYNLKHHLLVVVRCNPMLPFMQKMSNAIPHRTDFPSSMVSLIPHTLPPPKVELKSKSSRQQNPQPHILYDCSLALPHTTSVHHELPISHLNPQSCHAQCADHHPKPSSSATPVQNRSALDLTSHFFLSAFWVLGYRLVSSFCTDAPAEGRRHLI